MLGCSSGQNMKCLRIHLPVRGVGWAGGIETDAKWRSHTHIVSGMLNAEVKIGHRMNSQSLKATLCSHRPSAPPAGGCSPRSRCVCSQPIS